MFLGTLWSSIKQIKVPYVFYWEHGNALHAMQVNWASYRGKGDVSFFSRVATGTLCIIFSYGKDDPSKLVFVQRHQDSGLVTMDNSGISKRLVGQYAHFLR